VNGVLFSYRSVHASECLCDDRQNLLLHTFLYSHEFQRRCGFATKQEYFQLPKHNMDGFFVFRTGCLNMTADEALFKAENYSDDSSFTQNS
jgi:hypothetical protein